jgi:hypothetical protein
MPNRINKPKVIDKSQPSNSAATTNSSTARPVPLTKEEASFFADMPKRFRKNGQSFLKRLASSPRTIGMHSFGVFPKDVTFASQDTGEDVILVVRQSPFVFIPQYIAVICVMISPLIFFSTLSALNLASGSVIALGIAGTIVAFLVAIAIAFDTFAKWFYSVNIITSTRIVDVDFLDVMHHRFSETRLGNVEDVTHKVAGVFGSLFDYGTVFVQTAGAKPEFEFDNVPRPRDVQDTLLDVLDLHHKGEI